MPSRLPKLTLRAPPEEIEAWAAEARLQGATLNAWMRSRLNSKPDPLAILAATDPPLGSPLPAQKARGKVRPRSSKPGRQKAAKMCRHNITDCRVCMTGRYERSTK